MEIDIILLRKETEKVKTPASALPEATLRSWKHAGSYG